MFLLLHARLLFLGVHKQTVVCLVEIMVSMTDLQGSDVLWGNLDVGSTQLARWIARTYVKNAHAERNKNMSQGKQCEAWAFWMVSPTASRRAGVCPPFLPFSDETRPF